MTYHNHQTFTRRSLFRRRRVKPFQTIKPLPAEAFLGEGGSNLFKPAWLKFILQVTNFILTNVQIV